MTTTDRFAQADPTLAPGTEHQGFVVEKVEAVPELKAQAYVMRHAATGARLMWIACDDENRSFAIAFKTPPANSTGVFHIIEHSVLDGSRHYPVKEPFVHLIKSSMQTFLNALTFPDKTMYPVASTNVADLENLMSVYLDAVLDPDIYRRPRIFEQEGWHYEVSGEGDDTSLTYNGVVLNEMKGALSDPDEVLFEAVKAQLFPESPYSFDSGGEPRVIPQLTYEGFLDAHARHYQLSNSYTTLYGDLDIERMLAFVNDRFCSAPDRHAGAPNPLPEQAPVVAPLATVTMATAPENASVGLAYVLGSRSREEVLAADVLLDTLMGSNEAPLKRAILDADIANDVTVSLLDGLLQPFAFFQLKGAKEGAAERFRELLESECARIVREGIPREALEASLAQAEFNLREHDFSFYTEGVFYSVMAMSSWLYDDDDPTSYLRYDDALAAMKGGMDDGYFERLLNDLVCESRHTASVDLVPVEQGSADEEAAELAEHLATLSPEEVDAIRAEVEALRAEQERPDSPEAVATLPRLSVADIGVARPEPAQEQVEAPLPCVRHDIPTDHINYVYTYFDLRGVRWEELPYVTVLCDVLGKLDTARHTARELDTLTELNLGNLSFFVDVYALHDQPRELRPKLVVGTSSLSSKAAAAAELPQEIWSSTNFRDLERVRDILAQRKIGMEQAFLGAGHSAAMSRVASYFSQGALMDQQLSGVSFYQFLKDLVANLDERFDELCDKLEDLSRRIFCCDGAEVSFTGTQDDLDAWWAAAGNLSLGDGPAEQLLEVPEPEVRNEAFVVPGNVCFVSEGMDTNGLDFQISGSWQVAGRALSYSYLWNEVRVKGGAYGCGFRPNVEGVLRFYSFRDPAVDPTLDRYEAAAEWLRGWEPEKDELEGYVVSTVASYDSPSRARALARRQDSTRISCRPEGWREMLRQQVVETTLEQVRGCSGVLSELPGRRGVCVFGGRQLIEASKMELEVVDLMAE